MSWKRCYKVSIYFGWNTNGSIHVNPPRTTGSISPHINIMMSGNVIVFVRDSSDGVPPINISIFILFGRGTSDFSDRSASWHGAEKVKVKTLEATAFSKILRARIILKLKKLGAKIL